ncbi:DNA-binding protein [Biomphalaria pfeifferi]|uniref:DNA-binding protein n=1 Tax=Biomphalaria pfeifferi TaxID=112525 RepID=A0AAD8AMJ2_BIOPF|nr:DNA-binding protein [Biomphalaria pfeifferi]
MSLKEQQNLLARLYTDSELREDFFAEPDKIGLDFDLTRNEIAEIVEIAPQELEFFAESLFWKRLREAEKFIPLTVKALNQDFHPLFRQFSQIFNPQSVKKHLEDALEFCRFLQKGEVSEIAQNIAVFEKTKLEFFGYGKRIAFCKLTCDIKPFLTEDCAEDVKRKRKFAVWIKLGNKIRHFYI